MLHSNKVAEGAGGLENRSISYLGGFALATLFWAGGWVVQYAEDTIIQTPGRGDDVTWSILSTSQASESTTGTGVMLSNVRISRAVNVQESEPGIEIAHGRAVEA